MANWKKKVTYVQYDTNSSGTCNGNILEYNKENDVPVSIIWGYNKVYPIAVIQNATYSSITSSLITAAQTASLGTDEDALRTALQNIRSSLPNSMVTTYTYMPVYGISSVTDPKGDTLYYSYSYGRLSQVKDHSGNIVSENTYHYKPAQP